MDMLKFGYDIVLDGLPDIPEFPFFLGAGRPQTRFNLNVEFIFQKALHVWKDICLEAKHVGAHLIEKEMSHLKTEKNESFWVFNEPDTISLFCLLVYMYFLFISSPEPKAHR